MCIWELLSNFLEKVIFLWRPDLLQNLYSEIRFRKRIDSIRDIHGDALYKFSSLDLRFNCQLLGEYRCSIQCMIDESVINNDWCKNDNILVTYDILPTTAISQQFCLTFVDNPARTPPWTSRTLSTEHSMCGFSFLQLPGGAFISVQLLIHE